VPRLQNYEIYPGQRRIAAFAAPLTLVACFSLFSPPGGQRGGSLLRPPSGNMLFGNTMQVITDENPQPLKTTAAIISQKYCYGTPTTYTIEFTVRMRFVNRSGRKVIVQKNIGHGDYQIFIANSAKSLASGIYEYATNYQWTFIEVSPETREQFNAPGSGFAILAPGESLQAEIEFGAASAGSTNGPGHNRGTLDPGNHVFAIAIETWGYRTNADEVRKRWEPFGELFYKSIKTEPLSFSLPADPKIDSCPQH
jgi:hypothetical protein